MTNQLSVKLAPGSNPNTTIAHLSGPLIAEYVPYLQGTLRPIDSMLTVLEMSEVPHIDSLGMGALLNYLSVQKKADRRVAIAAPGKRVMMLIELTKINTVMPVFSTVEEAEQSQG